MNTPFSPNSVAASGDALGLLNLLPVNDPQIVAEGHYTGIPSSDDGGSQHDAAQVDTTLPAELVTFVVVSVVVTLLTLLVSWLASTYVISGCKRRYAPRGTPLMTPGEEILASVRSTVFGN